MAETEKTVTPEGVDDVRHQLIRRIAIAGITIVSLVAGLAVFDANYVGDVPKPPAPVAVAPVPAPLPAPAAEEPAVASSATQEPAIVEKAEGKIEPAAPVASKKPEVATPAERTAAPDTPPLRSVPRPLTKPATVHPASIKPGQAAPAVTTPEPAKALAASQQRNPPAKPLAQVAESQRRYVVQMGVFSNVSNAEDLYAKLQKAGIPAQIEARVHVGPFANRGEAEAAQKKLNEMGLDGGMLISSRK